MKSGIIRKVAATPANVPDGKALKHVCPKDGGMIFADKAYSSKETKNDIKRKGCYAGGVILKNNMKEKDFDKDRWTTKVRMPYEGTFSYCPRRARYKGLAKVQLQVFMEAVVHNLKRWIKIEELANDLGISFG
jgi:IS5 family transposase